MMTPEDIAIFAMMLNLDVEAGRAKLADRIRTEQAAAVAAERERCAFVCEENSRKYKNAQQEIAALQCAKAIRAVK